MEKKSSAKGVLILLITAIVWGFAFVAQTAGSAHVGSFMFNAIRFSLGVISLIPVILLFEKGADDPARKRFTLFAGGVCGVLLFAASTLQQLGITFYSRAGYPDSSGRAGFLTALYMVIVPIIGLFIKKRTGWVTWLGVVCAGVGLFFVSVTEAFTIRGEDLIMLGSAVLYAGHILCIDTCGEKIYSLRFAMVQFAVCALLSGLFQAGGELLGLVQSHTWSDIRTAAFPILYGGFMSVGVAYTLQILGQKRTEPALASVIMSSEAMFSAIGGALILGERMTGRGYLGCALIFAGVLLAQVPSRKQKNN